MPVKHHTIFKKGIVVIASFFLLMSAFIQVHAQCSASLKSVSYNTVLKGTGNNSWGFLFPQFNPSQGTLIAVSIKANISLSYSFNLENNSASSVAYTVSVKRRDSISSGDLSLPINNITSYNYGSVNLNASDGVSSSGSDYISQGKTMLLNNFLINDSIISDVVPFIGTNYAVFNYNPATITTVSGSASYSFTSAANDTMHFSLTYYYCNTILLSTTITDLTAAKQNDKIIKLSWTTQNELANRIYFIQKSGDGINFSETDSVRSIAENISSDYSDNYFISSSDRNKIYFRLKIIDGSGDVNYSEIRVVNLDESNSGIYLYPNPSNSFINIIFNGAPGNWQTDIFADNGQLIQRNYFANANSAHINFVSKPAPGVYFIHAFDTRSQKNYVASFIAE